METTSVSGQRRCQFWIDSFLELTADAQSPEIFRRWAAVATVAGALERKVWAKAFRGLETFPNIYALLVGPPGIGKTDALRTVHRFWESLPNVHVAPSSVSRASLIDALNEAERSLLRPDMVEPLVRFNSLQVAATEFGTFLTAYEGEFMSVLNDLWDCFRYKEKKRTKNLAIEIPKPSLTLIAGTTPAWLGSTLPETAWSEGFSSRLLVVFSAHRIRVRPFTHSEYDERLEDAMKTDIKSIHELYGQFHFDPDMKDAFIAGFDADFPPTPSHPKLEHYIPRRIVHLLKLTMIMSAARGDDLVLRLIDYQRALDLLLETEAALPDVFKSMRTGSDANLIDEVWNFVYVTHAKEGKAIPEQRIIYFISQKAPSYAVATILKTMVESGMLVVDSIAGVGGRPTYRPAPRGTF